MHSVYLCVLDFLPGCLMRSCLLSGCAFPHLVVRLPAWLLTDLSIYLSVCLSICLNTNLYVLVAIYLSACVPAGPHVYLSIYLSICLSPSEVLIVSRK